MCITSLSKLSILTPEPSPSIALWALFQKFAKFYLGGLLPSLANGLIIPSKSFCYLRFSPDLAMDYRETSGYLVYTYRFRN